MLKKIVIASLAGVLSACSTPSPMSFSLEQLGTEISKREGSNDDFHYFTSITVHGLSTPQIVGRLITVPGKNLPDLLATPISADAKTSVIVQTFDGPKNFNFSTYLSTMDKLVSIYADISALESKQLLLQTGVAYASDAKNKPANADSVANQISSTLSMPGFAASDISTKQQQLQTEITQKYKDAKTEETNLQAQGNQQNVWVWRWDSDNQTSTGGAIGSMGSASATSKNKRSGYMIVSGLRIVTLQPGNDFKTVINSLGQGLRNANFEGGKNETDGVYLVTQQLATEQLAFRDEADIEKALAAGADLKIADLGSGFAASLAQQQLRIEYTLRRALLAGTRGITKRTKIDILDYIPPSGNASSEYFSAGEKQYVPTLYAPFYTLRIEMKKLREWASAS